MNEEFAIECWTMLKGYIDKNHVDTAAEHFVDLLSDHTDDIKLISDLRGNDAALDIAIENYMQEHDSIFAEDD